MGKDTEDHPWGKYIQITKVGKDRHSLEIKRTVYFKNKVWI